MCVRAYACVCACVCVKRQRKRLITERENKKKNMLLDGCIKVCECAADEIVSFFCHGNADSKKKKKKNPLH